jgi:hypothetical protein
MSAPWKVVARRLANRRAAKARTRLAEELFIEAARRLIEEDEWRQSWSSRRGHHSSADVLAEPVLARRGIAKEPER